MTLNEANKKLLRLVPEKYIATSTWFNKISKFIDQIYNYHEAQLKAKDEKLQQLDDAYASVVSDFESAVMEIESLKAELAIANETIDGYAEVQYQMTP